MASAFGLAEITPEQERLLDRLIEGRTRLDEVDLDLAERLVLETLDSVR